MRVIFLGQDRNRIDRLTLALRLRWSELSAEVVSRKDQFDLILWDDTPSLIIVAQGLPDLSIFDLVAAVRTHSDVPLMVVAQGDVDNTTSAVKALELGADDHVGESSDLMEIMARAVALTRRAEITRRKADSHGPVECGALTIIPNTYEVFVGSDSLDLTPTEFKLLYALARNRGMIMTRESISRLLWINDYYCGDALNKYVQRLRRKLGDDAKNPTWIRTVHGVGYVMAA